MADQQVVKLLEEIRDLQKQQLENYKQVISGQQQALANQQQALETQKQVVRRSKVVLVAIGVIVLVLLGLPTFSVGNKLGFALSATALVIPDDFLPSSSSLLFAVL